MIATRTEISESPVEAAAPVSPQTAADEVRSGGTLIDVRTPAEFREVHAEGAENVPLDSLDPAAFADRPGPLLAICKSGSRSGQAVETLRSKGVRAVSVDGGTQGWEAADLPVVRGKKTMSLERQVRIAAGGLALLGALLALSVHPYFAGLPAFIGAGLVYAGLSDTCGMSLVLRRMPWNR